MSNIQLFNFESNQVRVIDIDNQPWLIGKDIALILGYSDTDQAIRKNVEEDDQKIVDLRNYFDYPSDGRVVNYESQKPKMIAINESGFYSLVLRSSKKEAKEIKKWVTSEVLPSIRTKGYYINNNLTNDTLLNAISELTNIVKINEENRLKDKQLNEEVVKYLTESNKNKDEQIKEFTKEQNKLNLVFNNYPGLERAINYFKENINDNDEVYFTLKKYLDDKEIMLSHGQKINTSRLVSSWLKVSGGFELPKTTTNYLLFQNKHSLLIDLAIINVQCLIY